MANEHTKVQRKLKSRHVSMIALGGTIGTGLFLSSGETVSKAGPAGALLAYALTGIMVYFLMTSLGEMATWSPTSGSISDYATRYVSPAFGFAMGWNYWLNWAITIAVDAATTGIVLQYWFPQVPGWIFSLTAILIIFALNAITVKAFGETEYWLAMIKVITILIFLAMGVMMIFGIIGGHVEAINNLTAGNHGFVHGTGGFLSVILIAGFSFQGTELLGVTAGETDNPDKSIPKAMNTIFWRIMLFYLCSIFVIAALIPYTDPRLLHSGSGNVAVSPFTIVFERVGLAIAASLMNAVILTSVISAANGGMYAASRMLFALGKRGDASKQFAKTTKNGVPLISLVMTTAVALLVFLLSLGAENVFLTLVSASSLTGFIAWIGIAVSHYRFRKAFVQQGHQLSELPYQAKWFPIGPIITFVATALVILGEDPKIFFGAHWLDGVVEYASLPIFLLLFVFYRRVHHDHLIKLDKIDLTRHQD